MNWQMTAHSAGVHDCSTQLALDSSQACFFPSSRESLGHSSIRQLHVHSGSSNQKVSLCDWKNWAWFRMASPKSFKAVDMGTDVIMWC